MMTRSIRKLVIAVLLTVTSTGIYAEDCGIVPPIEVDTESSTNVQLADSLKLKNPVVFIRGEGQRKAIIVRTSDGAFKIGPFATGGYRLYVYGWGDVELKVSHRGGNSLNYFLDLVPASFINKKLSSSKLCPTLGAVSN